MDSQVQNEPMVGSDRKSPAVTTRGAPGETYPEFQKRVAEDQARVDAKAAALDRFTPYCRSCGETCNPEEAGTTCKQNNMTMASRWARETAYREFYRLGPFGGAWAGAWANEVQALACLLDRVRARALDGEGSR